MHPQTTSTHDQQSFVYGEFPGHHAASAAVDALIEADIPADNVDVVRMKTWGPERMPIEHHRPVMFCTLVGLPVGLVIGLSVGFILASEPAAVNATTDLWTVLRFGWLGAAAGAFIGAIAGNGWWRTRLQNDKTRSEDRYFVVGTIVPDGRANDIEALLRKASPIKVGREPASGELAALAHAERHVINTP
jgi:hypothetical protein